LRDFGCGSCRHGPERDARDLRDQGGPLAPVGRTRRGSQQPSTSRPDSSSPPDPVDPARGLVCSLARISQRKRRGGVPQRAIRRRKSIRPRRHAAQAAADGASHGCARTGERRCRITAFATGVRRAWLSNVGRGAELRQFGCQWRASWRQTAQDDRLPRQATKSPHWVWHEEVEGV
jgi:hypothetical protein